MMTGIKLFRKFVKDCEIYSKSSKNEEKHHFQKKSSYNELEDEIEDEHIKKQNKS